MRFTLEEMLQKLPLPPNDKWVEGVWALEPFEKRGVRLVFFAPKGYDYQTLHDEDEFYFIVRGAGTIEIEGNKADFVAGDGFFVPAGAPHRFKDFTEDFATWAIFF